MALPAHRTTSTKRDKRRSHHALKRLSLARCAKCGNSVLSHQACINCGFYNSKEVINVLAKLDKKERKQKERELAREREEGKRKTIDKAS